MPVRRVENSHSTVNPAHSSGEVTEHYIANIPKEMPHGISTRLQSSITTAKGDRFATKNSFAHQTAITHALNDTNHAKGPEADAQLLEAEANRVWKTSLKSDAAANKLKACGSLTSSRAAYQDLFEGEASDSRSYLRGTIARPIQYHELPYGSECPDLIGDKASIYRADYCNSKAMQQTKDGGHCPKSPRLVSVYTSSTTNAFGTSYNGTVGNNILAANNRSQPASGTTSPRSGRQEETKQLGYNVYHGSQLLGSERMERAVDTQVRREMEYLKSSANKWAEEASTLKSVTDTIDTPRSQRLRTLQMQRQTALAAIPSPPSPRQAGCATNTSAQQIVPASPTSGPGTTTPRGSGRLQPIINRSTLEREVPQYVPTQGYATASKSQLKNLLSTIPVDTQPSSPRRV